MRRQCVMPFVSCALLPIRTRLLSFIPPFRRCWTNLQRPTLYTRTRQPTWSRVWLCISISWADSSVLSRLFQIRSSKIRSCGFLFFSLVCTFLLLISSIDWENGITTKSKLNSKDEKLISQSMMVNNYFDGGIRLVKCHRGKTAKYTVYGYGEK